ncbi:hypothetical protein F5B22DRAFT_636302 [Xylaria bambusicola]|uniref:uncharacterized protein n=1 Tax=Xylaria bambusicola TaxID=326684 RepID=UPI0020078FD9|nr:uncharacterized protein F5B22DRAFT_636302 [Xylaria bambusicola]KAI0516742.1 hypothetical protein F5B22DRAFT_636302 [Xylaria bambusicola]
MSGLPSPTEETKKSPLDIAISRLQHQLQIETNERPWLERDERGYQSLQTLCVANTSGDTLVIVRFPPGDFVDCSGHKWTNKEFLVESGQLLATGSSVFANLLSPKVQAQTRRLLNGDYAMYRYVLDLTPQTEGDESASKVAELSLSNGVIDWWKSQYVLTVSKSLVGGHDDNCPYHIEALIADEENREMARQIEGSIELNKLQYPRFRKILDYCSIRHRAAIIRLLLAISYKDLVLNSASRAFTMTMVARQFDCVKVVEDHVLTWLMAEPNQNFVEINAEDAFKIAWVLELPAIARMAFRVIVVERAIEIPFDKMAGTFNRRKMSIFQRPLGSLADEQETCVEHAAQKLIQRAKDLLTGLRSEAKFLKIKSWPVLPKELRAWMRQAVEAATAIPDDDNGVVLLRQDLNRARYVSEDMRAPAQDIYTNLLPAQWVLTTYFWELINSYSTPTHPRWSAITSKYPFPAQEFATAINKLNVQWAWPLLEVNIEKTGPLIFGLSDEEFKFLPLWAGGLDDGTGGVYQEEIPNAVYGFPIEPGPVFITGESIPDARSSTLDDATTIYTGVDTVTMTEGFSVQATRSQAINTGHDNAEYTALTTATTGLSLAAPQHPILTSNMDVDSDVPRARGALHIDEDFDWTAGGSECDNLSDLDCSDSDFGFEEIKYEDQDDSNAMNSMSLH